MWVCSLVNWLIILGLRLSANDRGAGTYKDTRTCPDQVFGKLAERQYFLTKKCYLIDIRHFILRAQKTIEIVKLIRCDTGMILGKIGERSNLVLT